MIVAPDVALLPMPYVCAECGASGVRLWRDYGLFLRNISLRCRGCSEEHQAKYTDKLELKRTRETDQIGWLVPAVPTDDGTFWGYASTPNHAYAWWEALPQ